MEKTLIRITGVPEHFNYPWHVAREQGLFEDLDAEIRWQDEPRGTGAMCRALRAGEVEVAIVLTEGAVADIIAGNSARIVGIYVNSPLIWGVHVHATEGPMHPASLESQRFAISRYGSGSHLMAMVHAQQSGWDPKAMRFEIVNTLDGAKEALAAGKAEGFMWEKFTTKPLVDNGMWRRVGEVRTPWPCFAILARPEVYTEQEGLLKQILTRVRKALYLMDGKETLAYLSEHYKLAPRDIEAWYAQTEWLIRPEVGIPTLDSVQDILLTAEVIKEKIPSEQLCAPMCTLRKERISSSSYDWRIRLFHQAMATNGLSQGPLELAQLRALDQLDLYRYLDGHELTDLIKLLGLDSEKVVCEIGSVLGGKGREIALATGCKVWGTETQTELITLAEDLNNRLPLTKEISYWEGEFVDFVPKEKLDAVLSFQSLSYLKDRDAALAHTVEVLKPGGKLVVESLFSTKESLQGSAAYSTRQVLKMRRLQTLTQFRAQLSDLGFTELVREDRSAIWYQWAVKQVQELQVQEDAFRAFFGEKLYNNRVYFYKVLRDLLEQEILEGFRLIAIKKAR